MEDPLSPRRIARAQARLAAHDEQRAKVDAATEAIVKAGERAHAAKVHVIDGVVFIALPGDQYIKMTPEQARQMGGRLFLKAAEAEGHPAPAMIALTVED